MFYKSVEDFMLFVYRWKVYLYFMRVLVCKEKRYSVKFLKFGLWNSVDESYVFVSINNVYNLNRIYVEERRIGVLYWKICKIEM